MNEAMETKEFIYEFGTFVLDAKERILLDAGRPVHLTDKVFDTLLLLIEHNGRLLTKDEMMASIWEESFVEESNLAKNISRLRKILNVDGLHLIETLPRRGYRFTAQVRQIDRETDLLVHRQLRVKFSQTIENGDQHKKHASLGPSIQNTRPKIQWFIGGFALLLFTGIVLTYNFATSNKLFESGGLTNLTNSIAEDTLPAWSPDGSKLAFTSNRDGTGDIYIMNSDGSGVTRLTDTSAKESSPVWSPDGKNIMFDSDRDGNREIYIMNTDGSGQTRLTFNPTTDAGPASFSPDGKRIAFSRNASNEGGAVYNYDIYVMKVDGSDLRQLTTDPEFDAEPIWSPDGNRILFISGRDRNFEIYAINQDGSGETNLTKSVVNEGVFAFTEDGKRFFCFGDSPEKIEFNQVYLINMDGTNRRQITSFTDKVYRVAYSPRAKKFAVSGKKEGNFEIYAMDAASLPVD